MKVRLSREDNCSCLIARGYLMQNETKETNVEEDQEKQKWNHSLMNDQWKWTEKCRNLC